MEQLVVQLHATRVIVYKFNKICVDNVIENPANFRFRLNSLFNMFISSQILNEERQSL